ncbi:Tim44 domain-containing protein [Curvibacter sp. CHRR-16]|uniref:Tim44 domain-containing protein n=1 Tax=Curvibacter sp. CHRR-16 TaxID=2835872 RepID=UPI001BDAFDA0|nr:Tim44-like domain-containing protein [Curvibacter sp. CHRR-16]MBT0569666.1 Tim44 domain-containing protein [Curvibacter sp. CHRR-16]
MQVTGWLIGLFALVLVAGTSWLWWRKRQQVTASLAAPVVPTVRSSSYKPDNVGNDASARPWEQGDLVGADLHLPSLNMPAGFDAVAFVELAKKHFLALQDAWDKADMALLRSRMTDGMLLEVHQQLLDREALGSEALAPTEVVMLQARLVGVESLPQEWLVNVEFSGLIREDASAGPNPFREVWSMVKPLDGRTDWLVAGVQAFQ